MKCYYASHYSESLEQQLLTGKIHSVFNKTINIVTNSGKLYTLATEEIFDGPNMIKVPISSWLFLKNSLFKEITQQEDALVIDNQIKIKLSKAVKIPTLNVNDNLYTQEETITKAIDINNYLTKELDTVGFYRQTFMNEVEKTLFGFLIERSSNLVDSLVQKETAELDISIKKLVGLGHGLTPSGDDFLTGVALILNSQKNLDKQLVESFNLSLIKHAKGTNLISQKQLELAIAKQSLKPIVTFINELYSNPTSNCVNEKLEAILSVGSSSGSDIVYGILSGIKMLNSKQVD